MRYETELFIYLSERLLQETRRNPKASLDLQSLQQWTNRCNKTGRFRFNQNTHNPDRTNPKSRRSNPSGTLIHQNSIRIFLHGESDCFDFPGM